MAKTKLGKVAITPKGEWSATVAYEALDLVSYNGSSWLAKQASTGVTPAAGDYWTLSASKGDTGSDAQVTTDNIVAALGYTPADKDSLDLAETTLAEMIINSSDVPWKAVQKIVQAGAGEKFFPVGTQLQVTSQSYGTLLFDVVAHNFEKNPNDATAPTMTLMMHDCFFNRAPDSTEYFWWNNTGAELAAGTYHFTVYKAGHFEQTTYDGTYQFTTTQAIPADARLLSAILGKISSTKQWLLNNGVELYDTDDTLIEKCALTEGSEGTDLGTISQTSANIVDTLGKFNSSGRCSQGSNNWAQSNIRQWMNSDAAAGAWWTKQTPFDRRSDSYDNVRGLKGDLDTEFVAVLGEVDIETQTNYGYEYGYTAGETYTTRDLLFLPGYSNVNTGDSQAYEYFKDATNAMRQKNAVNEERTNAIWFLRTPSWSYSYALLICNNGSVSYNNIVWPYYPYGCVPTCVIY